MPGNFPHEKANKLPEDFDELVAVVEGFLMGNTSSLVPMFVVASTLT